MKHTKLIIITLLFAIKAWADTPTKINYVGTLADGGGNLVNATLPIAFALYEQDTGGTAIWSETQTVEVVEGSFSVELGAVNSLSFDLFNTSVYLGMNVDNDGEMSPRQPFNTVPYAYKADSIYDQVLIVRGAGSPTANGQQLIDTVAMAGVATPDKPILIFIEPGQYDLGAQGITLHEHSQLQGFDAQLTTITSSGKHTITMANNSDLKNLTINNSGSGASQDFNDPSASVFVDNIVDVNLTDLNLKNLAGTITDGVRTGLYVINSELQINTINTEVNGGHGAYGVRVHSGGVLNDPSEVVKQVNLQNIKAKVAGSQTCRGVDVGGAVFNIENVDAEVQCDGANSIGFRLQAWGRGSVSDVETRISGITSEYSLGIQFFDNNQATLSNFKTTVTGSTAVNQGLFYGTTAEFPQNTFTAQNGQINIEGTADYQFGVNLWSGRPVLSNVNIKVEGQDSNTKSRGISFGYDFGNPITPQNSVMQLNHSHIEVTGTNSETHAIAGTDFQIEVNQTTLKSTDQTITLWPSNFAQDSEIIIRNSALHSINNAASVNLWGGDGMGPLNAIVLNSHLSGSVQAAGNSVIPTATCAGNTTGTYQFLTNTCP